VSTRLQVLMDDDELARIRSVAEREGVSVADWVRRTLKGALQEQPQGDRDKKIARVRAAAAHAFPTAEIEQMLAEIEAARSSGLP
jgi:negative regulator of replication initiation